MRADEAREIVQRHIAWFKWGFGLNSWTIHTRYEALNQGTIGRCYADAKYETATIILDAEQMDDEDEILDTLRHEIFHIMHAEFDAVVDSIVENLDSKSAQKLVRSMQSLAQERTVRMFEYMFDSGLGIISSRIVGLASLQARRSDIDDFEEPVLAQDLPEVAPAVLHSEAEAKDA